MAVNWHKIEAQILAPQAALAAASKGREKPEAPCPIRTCYQRDRDRIIHAKAFRRLKTKTQVFIAPYGDHYRTRLTHTLEVMQIARTIGRALSLNEDLTEAIALGHDLGHTPFGHGGERALAEITGHFMHNEQSRRVVDVLEKNGQGLNLTYEVRDGILNHSGSLQNLTLEGSIVQISDRIAYVNHDIDDAIRANMIQARHLPARPMQILGAGNTDRINSLVLSVIDYSRDLTQIGLPQEFANALDELRAYLFEKVYQTKDTLLAEEKLKTRIQKLFQFYLDHPQKVPAFYLEHTTKEQGVCDYIAGMSDSFAFGAFEKFQI